MGHVAPRLIGKGGQDSPASPAPEHPRCSQMPGTPRVVPCRGTPRVLSARERGAEGSETLLSAGPVSAGDAAAGRDPPPNPKSCCKQSPPSECGEGLCLSMLLPEREDEGHYLVGSPRLFVRPVLVVADVPPLYLKGVGGGAAASEGARHLHVLARLGRHVVGCLGEEGCRRQSKGCGRLRGRAAVPARDDATGHASGVTRSARTLPRPNRPGTLSRRDRSLPHRWTPRPVPGCPSPAPLPPPQHRQSRLVAPGPWHFAKSSGRKGREQEPLGPPAAIPPPRTSAPECARDPTHLRGVINKQSTTASLLRSEHKQKTNPCLMRPPNSLPHAIWFAFLAQNKYCSEM